MDDPDETQHLGQIGLENFAPYLMNRIMGRYNASLQGEMASLGLTTPQMRSLAVLSMIDGILISDLTVYTVVPHSTLSRALDGLEAQSMIRRVRDARDARATRVHLTEAGRACFDAIWPHMAQSYRAMFRGIGADERRAFQATLQKLLRNVRKHDL